MLNTETTTQVFPLSSLRLSPLNVRQERDPAAVQDLVASIRSTGQIQNLAVTVSGNKKKPVREVVAGGRRLLALEVLRDLGELPKDHPVKCEVVDEARALEISTAENTQRKAMSPVEEVQAFARLTEGGMPIEDIAARFGVTPLVVSRRLKLAALSPKLLALYSSDEITLEQLMALTVSDSHAKQEECWFSANQWNREPEQLRSRLTGDMPTTEEYIGFKLIGADKYREAGGVLTTDLFEDHGGYINDVALVDRLVAEVLEVKAVELRASGWATVHVEPQPHNEYDFRNGAQKLRRTMRELTEDETDKLDTLTEQINEKSQALEALNGKIEAGDIEDEDAAYEQSAEIEEAISDLEQQCEALRESASDFTADQKAVGYCVVYLTRQGGIGVLDGLLEKGKTDPSPAPQNSGGASGGDLGLGYGSSGGSKGFHGEKLVQVLTAERSLAWQAVLMADPSLALLAALERLVPRCIGDYGTTGDRIKLSATLSTDSHLSTLTDEDNTPAAGTVRSIVGQWKERYQAHFGNAEEASEDEEVEAEETAEEGGPSVLSFLLALTPEERFTLHAVCVAMTLDVKVGQDHLQVGDEFSRHCQLDMRQWWTPTAKRYFGMLSKKQIIHVLGEAGCPVEGLDKLKKDDLAQKAESLMATHAPGWLPSPLRG